MAVHELSHMSYKVAKIISFCYGHRLLNYEGKCRHPHGHNGRLEIELTASQLDARGMVVDFTDIKRLIAGWIDTLLDHKMILHREDPLLPILQKMGEPVYIMDENPTVENIAKLIYHYAVSQHLPVSEIRLWESETSYASYGGV